MTEEQADRWIAITPSESQTHTHNANTHIHTLEHTHSNTHTCRHTLFPLVGGERPILQQNVQPL